MTTSTSTLSAATRPRPVSGSGPLAWSLLLAGALGLAASAVLTLEKIRLLENPNYRPSCNINPIISCGSVMRTPQAAAFGFPNPFLGIAGFSAVIVVGAALLAGAAFRRWFWLGLQAGVLFGGVFVHWLIDQTLYHIGALCPYCMVVWTATIPLFWYVTLHNVRRGVIPVPGSWRPAVRVVARYHWVVPLAWYVLVALLILNRFWYYWRTLL
ncbi:vitamin K epoxide reductase family protein [Actinoallomurus iriomotensis]|uniref:Membrane protein n=1 Tax=Actinoallomurus iriomotensis TaxID=478107 RepID=A0A9W6RYB7_9ACTN|nr:vitamin K epoxide reductase family protein [Actinoallomurus iriomotensis]GLY83971.1 membrane protein [Actinoallomurus iriomotensis]